MNLTQRLHFASKLDADGPRLSDTIGKDSSESVSWPFEYLSITRLDEFQVQIRDFGLHRKSIWKRNEISNLDFDLIQEAASNF